MSPFGNGQEEELKDAVVLIYANKQVDFYDKSLQICLLLNSDADKGWAGRYFPAKIEPGLWQS
jgi:hypothetical protein